MPHFLLNRPSLQWAGHLLGLWRAHTQTTSDEQKALARWAAEKGSLVEIGVHQGANSLNLRRVMSPDAHLHLIDPFPHGRLPFNFNYLIARCEVSKAPNGSVTFVRKLSWEAAADWSHPIDFLFIDGDHAYESVKRDWEDWSVHVVKGGIIALHDSQMFPDGWTREDWGPVRLVRELTDGGREEHSTPFAMIDVCHSLSIFRRSS